jgi:ABC-type branched-subunit amino acid transport system substrate-binding protein
MSEIQPISAGRRRVRLPRKQLVAALLGVTLAVAACGGSSDSDKSDGAGATAPKPTGAPIKLGLMTGIQTDAVSQPWVAQAAKVAAAAVNANGGILGRPVEIDVCDDHSTPQGASVCAQKLLVEDKVLMMSGDDGTQEPSLLPTLDTANTISWASLGAASASLQNPRVYVIEPVLVSFRILPQMLPDSTKHVAYVSADSAIAQSSAKVSASYYPPSITVDQVKLGLTATDFQPTCLQIKQSGADTVVPAINPRQLAPLIQTCNQIGLNKVLWALPSIVLTPQVVETVSNLNQPNLVVLSFGEGAIGAFNDDVTKYAKQVGGITNTIGDSAINAWLSVKLLADIIPKVGVVDAVKIREYLDKQTALDTQGATAPIDFTSAGVQGIPRVKNQSASQGEIKDGKLVVTVEKPFIVGKPQQ